MRSLSGILHSLFGSAPLLRFGHRKSFTVVLYHAVAPLRSAVVDNGRTVSPETFDRHLGYLQSRYDIVPITELIERSHAGETATDMLAIVFLEGYRSVYENAFPLLKQRTIPAHVLLNREFVHNGEALWTDRLRYAIDKNDTSPSEKQHEYDTELTRLESLSPQIREHDLRNIEQIAWIKFSDFAEDRSVFAPLTEPDIAVMRDAGTTSETASLETMLARSPAIRSVSLSDATSLEEAAKRLAD